MSGGPNSPDSTNPRRWLKNSPDGRVQRSRSARRKAAKNKRRRIARRRKHTYEDSR